MPPPLPPKNHEKMTRKRKKPCDTMLMKNFIFYKISVMYINFNKEQIDHMSWIKFFKFLF